MGNDSPRRYRDRLLAAYVSARPGYGPRPPEAPAGRADAQLRAVLGPYLPADRQAAILDLGCGSGRLVAFLRRQGFQRARGVDVSAEQVELAHRLGVAAVEQAEAAAYVGQHPATYDLITCFDLIEHLTKDEVVDLLEGVGRALRPGGRLVIQAPNACSPFAGRYRYGDLTHELAFTPSSLSQVLRAVGFGQVTVAEARPAGHGPKGAARAIAWKAIRLGLVAYLAVETGVARGHVLTQNLIAVAEKGGV